LLTCSICILATAQEDFFTQYNLSKTNTNSAFTGSDSAFVLSSAATFPTKEKDNEIFFSADNYFHFLRGGLGITYNRESLIAGSLITSRINLTYAPHFEFFNHRLAFQPGISIGYFQRYIDWSKLTFGNMIDEKSGFIYDPQETKGLDRKSNLDFSAGVLLFTKLFYGGFAIHHITQPDEGLASPHRLLSRYTAHAGANIPIGSYFIVSPNLMYVQQGDFSMFLTGITAKYKWLVAGASFGNSNTFVSTIGLQNRFFRISYSYWLQNSPNAVNEIHFNWFFKHKNKKQLSLRMI